MDCVNSIADENGKIIIIKKINMNNIFLILKNSCKILKLYAIKRLIAGYNGIIYQNIFVFARVNTAITIEIHITKREMGLFFLIDKYIEYRKPISISIKNINPNTF